MARDVRQILLKIKIINISLSKTNIYEDKYVYLFWEKAYLCRWIFKKGSFMSSVRNLTQKNAKCRIIATGIEVHKNIILVSNLQMVTDIFWAWTNIAPCDLFQIRFEFIGTTLSCATCSGSLSSKLF